MFKKNLHDTKYIVIFFDIYIHVKFHALSVYEVFRAIRARQTTRYDAGTNISFLYSNGFF